MKHFTSVIVSFWFVAIVTLLLYGCDRAVRYPDELAVADSLANVEPEEAIRLLQGLREEMASAPEPTLRTMQGEEAELRHRSSLSAAAALSASIR